MLVLPRAVAVWGREVIDPDGDGTAVPIGKYKGLLAIAPLGVHHIYLLDHYGTQYHSDR